MRKRLFLICAFLLMFLFSAKAETLLFNGAEYDTEAENIDMGDTKIQDLQVFYHFLEQFPNLKKVDMFNTPVRRSQIETMTAKFPEVEFGWTMQFAEHTVRTDVTAYSTLHWSKDQKHGNADISLVRYCKNLKALDIGHNAVTDLSFLYDLPDLRVLIIACNRVKDITPIGSLKRLEYLELFTNEIEDITPLTGLTNLMDLNIAFNYIQDISPILTLKNLKRLWAGDMECLKWAEEQQFLSYQRDRLEAWNFWTDIPTLYGWRGDEDGKIGHPRYEIIKAMFKEGVYYDFDTVLRPEQHVYLYKKRPKN